MDYKIPKKIYYLSLILICLTSYAEAEIYKWTDKNGIVNYAASPPSGVNNLVVDISSAPSNKDAALAENREKTLMQKLKKDELKRHENIGSDGPILNEAQLDRCVYIQDSLPTLKVDRPVYMDDKGVYRAVYHRQLDPNKEIHPYVSDGERQKLIEQYSHEKINICDHYSSKVSEHRKKLAREFFSSKCIIAKKKLRSIKLGLTRNRSEDELKKKDILEKAVTLFCYKKGDKPPKYFVDPGVLDEIN